MFYIKFAYMLLVWYFINVFLNHSRNAWHAHKKIFLEFIDIFTVGTHSRHCPAHDTLANTDTFSGEEKTLHGLHVLCAEKRGHFSTVCHSYCTSKFNEMDPLCGFA